MEKLAKLYVKELDSSLGYLGTWLPTTLLALGDILEIDARGARVVGSLTEQSLSFATRAGGRLDDIHHETRSGVEMSLSGSERATEGASPLLSIRFKSAFATLFAASGCRSALISDIGSLGSDILERYRSRLWSSRWLVVTELVSAERTAVLVASSEGASLEMDASATGASWKALVTFDAAARVVRSSGLATKVLASEQLTPLFRCCAIKHGLRGARFRNSEATADAEDVVFSRVSADSLGELLDA